MSLLPLRSTTGDHVHIVNKTHACLGAIESNSVTTTYAEKSARRDRRCTHMKSALVLRFARHGSERRHEWLRAGGRSA
jgi:hypothetical protein